jgi:hypothetical protein
MLCERGTSPLRLTCSTSQFQGIFSGALFAQHQGDPFLRTSLIVRILLGSRLETPPSSLDSRYPSRLAGAQQHRAVACAPILNNSGRSTNLGRAVRQAGADQSLRAAERLHHTDPVEFWRSLPNQGLATQILGIAYRQFSRHMPECRFRPHSSGHTGRSVTHSHQRLVGCHLY